MNERLRSFARRTPSILASILTAITLFAAGTPVFAASDTGERMLVPLGNTAGIRMFADGILVVGISRVECGGKETSPAEEAGIEVGDRIIEINSEKMQSASQLRETINSADTLDITLERGGKELNITAHTVTGDADGEQKLGVWVRDSLAGIGTLTYYDEATGQIGALGHGVTDSDTRTLMPIASGSLVRSSVESVRKGTAGSPGELKGKFEEAGEYGILNANTDRGVFGTAEPDELEVTHSAIPAASIDEIRTGDAAILSSVEGDEVKEYAIKILRVYADESKTPRDLLIEVTDPELIAKTGGIVQGMSGSPIIQDGKLVGAVTHVLINDPLRGYGISIDNMLEYADNLYKLAA